MNKSFNNIHPRRAWGGCTLMACTALLCMLSACSSDDNTSSSSSTSDAYASFAMDPFTAEDASGEDEEVSTRAVLQYKIEPHYIHSYWDKNNSVGVFPTGETNSQMKYDFVCEDAKTETGKVIFKGKGWNMQKGNSYAAYYPYLDLLGSANYNEIPMVFNNQVQKGNRNLDHIGASYDFMYSQSKVAVDSTTVFDFHHVNGLYQLKLRPGKKAKWSSVSLYNINGTKIFCDSAYLNISDGSVRRLKDSYYTTLRLQDVETTTDDDTLFLYLSTLPIEHSDTMIVSLCDDNGYSYNNYVRNTYMKAGQFSPIGKKMSTDMRLYVDLGLPSGNLWSICNLGAFMPWEQGFYFSWGMLWPVGRYFWDNYRFSFNSDGEKGTSLCDLYKYTIEDGVTDGVWYSSKGTFQGDDKRLLEKKYTPKEELGMTLSTDDAAQYSWGGEWQVPTSADFQELLDNCKIEWKTNYCETGTNGLLVTATNGNCIFLPAAGWAGCIDSYDNYSVELEKDQDGFYTQGKGRGWNEGGYYWTANLSDPHSYEAKEFIFDSHSRSSSAGSAFRAENINITPAMRYLGNTIRPVIHGK